MLLLLYQMTIMTLLIKPSSSKYGLYDFTEKPHERIVGSSVVVVGLTQADDLLSRWRTAITEFSKGVGRLPLGENGIKTWRNPTIYLILNT